jgi:FkbM family methyltransferase
MKLGTTIEEAEQGLLSALTDPSAMAVDVGADEGRFIVHMLGQVSEVLAFEPRPHQASLLKAMAQTLALPVKIESVALSDRTGTATLRILVKEQGRSTIDPSNALDDPDGSARAEVQVAMKRLDDYGLCRVGFLKIDVEGHELAVLKGAAQTVERTRCNVLVEAEDRHHPGATAAVFTWMADRGYLGYFLLEGKLTPVSAFDPQVHQNKDNIGGWRSRWERRGAYVNNFIFVPPEREAAFITACAALGAPLAAYRQPS